MDLAEIIMGANDFETLKATIKAELSKPVGVPKVDEPEVKEVKKKK